MTFVEHCRVLVLSACLQGSHTACATCSQVPELPVATWRCIPLGKLPHVSVFLASKGVCSGSIDAVVLIVPNTPPLVAFFPTCMQSLELCLSHA